MVNVLTVFFSRSGNTEKVVNKIQDSIKGDVELIKERGSRKGIIGWIRSGGQNSRREIGKIEPTEYDPADYDIVILASPIWAGTVSSPMRGYMTKNKNKLRRTAVFLTNDSGNLEVAYKEIYEILPAPPIIEGSLQRSRFQDELEYTVGEFVKKILALDQ
jgi:flavodoxin